MYESVITENIRKIIKTECLSQGAIAKKAGYDGKKFSNMLNGRKVITDVDVINIAKALDVTPNTLFGINTNEEEQKVKEVG